MKYLLLALFSMVAISENVNAAPAVTPSVAAKPQVKDPIVIVMGKRNVKLSEVMPMLLSLVGGNINNLSKEEILRAITLAKQMFVMQEILSTEALKKNYDANPKFKAAFEKAKRNTATSIYIKEVENTFKDEELKKLYPEFVAKQPKMKEYSFRMIVVKKADEAKMITTALSSGANFSKLATEKSTHASADRGGDQAGLIPFAREDMIARAFGPQFVSTLSSLGKGEVKMVQLPNKEYAIIKLEGKREAAPISLADAMPQLRMTAANNKLLKMVEDKMKSGEIGFYGMDGKKEDLSFDNKKTAAKKA